ncbi:hypothetical protein BDM02DRAFT_388919 [Thelephora ganbajun]|uniref:Uncharacterized protein n=1 Tax=Thelephora ganbajun TaxID=370292 RepID=A0ACB6Z8U9_THEGA|nr:hypothetical protein BDM02DRAFT_388919 [Thelephora ganbajun]
MSAKRACLTCRARKVKCVPGPTQRCERCTTLELQDCVYKQIKKRGVGKILRMGEACKLCRARKRKCDAKRPCTTCVNANRVLECEYEIVGPAPRPSGSPKFLFWNEPGPPGSNDVFTRGRWAIGAVLPEPPTNPVATITRFPPEAIPTTRMLVRSLVHNRLSPYISPRPPPHTFNTVRAHGLPPVTLPPFSVTSSLVFPRVPPKPHVVLSLLGTERLQLSDTALGDLNMKFRLRILCRLNKLGVRFTSEKQQALLRGDTSGTVIHPFFVHYAQTLGMYFCEDMDPGGSMRYGWIYNLATE